jgi:hypothetical protein
MGSRLQKLLRLLESEWCPRRARSCACACAPDLGGLHAHPLRTLACTPPISLLPLT